MVSTEKVLLTSACGLCKDRFESISDQEVVAETHKGREKTDLEDRESALVSGARVWTLPPGESLVTGTNDADISQSLLAHVGANT